MEALRNKKLSILVIEVVKPESIYACRTPRPTICISLLPWITGSWGGRERSPGTASHTSKSQLTSFRRVFCDRGKQTVARGWGKHIYSYCIFAQEQSKKSTNPLILSNSELPLWPPGRSALLWCKQVPARGEGVASGPHLPGSPLPSCVPLGKRLHLSVPECSQHTGVIIPPCKCLELCLHTLAFCVC